MPPAMNALCWTSPNHEYSSLDTAQLGLSFTGHHLDRSFFWKSTSILKLMRNQLHGQGAQGAHVPNSLIEYYHYLT